MEGGTPRLDQLNLVVKDMDATLAFYRRLGLAVDAPAGAEHVAVRLDGLLVEFDSVDFARTWNSDVRETTGGTTVLGFGLSSRTAVDEMYAKLTSDGSRGAQPPYDAFWGARYAIVADPDGNPVGLMSPIEDSKKFWPPQAPPTAAS